MKSVQCNSSLLLIGCGKMGSALLARWKTITTVHTIDPAGGEYRDLASLPSIHPDIIVFAIKPQQMAEVLPSYRQRFGVKPLYISIAAGKATAFLSQYLGSDARIVRAMPNTPALIGQGMSVLYGNAHITAQDKTAAAQMLQAVGKVEWIEDEALMDAVTALSGSGPAYAFLFLDSLIKAATAAGLPPDLAKTLAIETVSGSCALASQSSESLEQLRHNVTSPGGTTEAALKVLMQGDALENLIANAVQAAAKRSKNLSNQ